MNSPVDADAVLNSNVTATVDALSFSLLGSGGTTHADVVSTPTVLRRRPQRRPRRRRLGRRDLHRDRDDAGDRVRAQASASASASRAAAPTSNATLNPTVKAFAGTNGALGGRNIGFAAMLNASPNGAKADESVGNIALGIGINGGNAVGDHDPDGRDVGRRPAPSRTPPATSR